MLGQACISHVMQQETEGNAVIDTLQRSGCLSCVTDMCANAAPPPCNLPTRPPGGDGRRLLHVGYTSVGVGHKAWPWALLRQGSGWVA